MRRQSKVALISGGARGMGAAEAKLFAGASLEFFKGCAFEALARAEALAGNTEDAAAPEEGPRTRSKSLDRV